MLSQSRLANLLMRCTTDVHGEYGRIMTDTLIAFGTNLTNDEHTLASVLDKVLTSLDTTSGVTVCAVSRRFRSPAWPPGSGPEFLNAALRLVTALEASEVLTILHGIEDRLGRTRPVRWGPRVCDLDLIMHGDEVHPDPATASRWMALDDVEAARTAPDRLILPHPRMHLRGFVLLPVMDIAPDWRHPILGSTVREMVEALPPSALDGVRPR